MHMWVGYMHLWVHAVNCNNILSLVSSWAISGCVFWWHSVRSGEACSGRVWMLNSHWASCWNQPPMEYFTGNWTQNIKDVFIAQFTSQLVSVTLYISLHTEVQKFSTEEVIAVCVYSQLWLALTYLGYDVVVIIVEENCTIILAVAMSRMY